MKETFDTIRVIDFGGQYCHLIARRVREQGVYSEIVPCDMTEEEMLSLQNKMTIKGIILSGGPYKELLAYPIVLGVIRRGACVWNLSLT